MIQTKIHDTKTHDTKTHDTKIQYQPCHLECSCAVVTRWGAKHQSNTTAVVIYRTGVLLYTRHGVAVRQSLMGAKLESNGFTGAAR